MAKERDKRGVYDWWSDVYSTKDENKITFDIPHWPVGDDVSMWNAKFVFYKTGKANFKGTLHSSDSGDHWDFGIIEIIGVGGDRLSEWNGIVSNEIPENGFIDWKFNLEFKPIQFPHIHRLTIFSNARAGANHDKQDQSFEKIRKTYKELSMFKEQYLINLNKNQIRNDGPPWIQKVYKGGVVLGHIALGQGWHIELDENKRWKIECSTTRPTGNANEISIHFIKPGFSWESFLNYNDSYPALTGPWTGIKFDNEDIYLLAFSKPKFGVGNFSVIHPTDVEIHGRDEISARMIFTNDEGVTATVVLTVQP